MTTRRTPLLLAAALLWFLPSGALGQPAVPLYFANEAQTNQVCTPSNLGVYSCQPVSPDSDADRGLALAA